MGYHGRCVAVCDDPGQLGQCSKLGLDFEELVVRDGIHMLL